MCSAMAVLSRFRSEGVDRLANCCSNVNGVRGVRMNADGIDPHRDALTGIRDGHPLGEGKARSFRGQFHRSFWGSPKNDETSICAVAEIDIELGYKRDVALSCDAFVSRAGNTVDGHFVLKRNVTDRIHQGVI